MAPPSPSPPAAASSSGSPPEPTNSFVPRPFPPPSLAGIPLEYVVNSLRRLAPQYWNNTESADCSIGASEKKKFGSSTKTLTEYPVYPLVNHPLDLSTVVDDSGASRVPRSDLLSSSHDPSSMGRRLTAPNLNRQDVRMLMKVCRLYHCQGTRSPYLIRYTNSSTSTTSPHNQLSCVPSSAAHPHSI
jgi:hypothetical protein